MRPVVDLVDRRLMACFFLALLIGNLYTALGPRVYAASQSKFELTVQRAKELDQIESLPWPWWLGGQDGADWRMKVQFYNGNQWLPWENERSGGDNNPDANQLDQAYSWTFDTPSSHIIRFRIMLWDDDTWEIPDLADISSKTGEGVKDWNGAFVAGAIFEGVYNIETGNFTSDSDQVQLRYNPAMGRIMHVASGEYDGTYGSGGLDAELWFEVKGEFHEGVVPSDIAVMNVVPIRTLLTSPYPNYIWVDVRNNCSNIVRTYIDVYANNSVISTEYVELPAYQQHSFTVVWHTEGFEGTYIVSARARQLSDETDISNNMRIDGPVTVINSQKACAIIVAGSLNPYDPLNDAINYGCNQVYRILRKVGLSADNIWYMNPPEYRPQDVDADSQNDIDDLSTSSNLRRAIENWARYRVTSSSSLFLYLFDHGGLDEFCIAPGDSLYPSQLASWLDNLKAITGAQSHLIYAACHSGSFIDELSRDGRIIVTSCKFSEFSAVGPDGTWEAFSIPFWNSIKSGHSISDSFDSACSQLSSFKWDISDWINKYYYGNWQTPLLDDNGDALGNTSPLPSGGDGYLAQSIHIGACEWSFPWISHAMPSLRLSWPPPSAITLWAKVENNSDLLHVRAWMFPPDLAPPNSTDTLVSFALECFEMADLDNDGNWTAAIPSADFMNHTAGPGNFTFLITAEEENGDVATPSIVSVRFTDGAVPADTFAPHVFVERPLKEQIVYDLTVINGTAADDTCLSRIELWQEITFLGIKFWWPTQTITLPQESTSYFEFQLNTTTLTNGPSRVFLRAYDTSSNYYDQNVTFLVNHDIHDIAVTDIEIPDAIERGQLVFVNVTVANYGSYQESFDLDLYLNMTLIATQTVNLTEGSSSTVALIWNTSDFDLGYYTISSYAWPVPDENNTENNLYLTSLVNLNEPPTHTLTLTTTAGGTTDPSPGVHSYPINSSVQVTAIPEYNYLLDHWELDSVTVGSTNPYSVFMDANHTLKATFKSIPPLLVAVSPASASILLGQSVSFTSAVNGGVTPYSYQWYLNSTLVSGAIMNSWAFTPASTGAFNVYLKVTDTYNSTAQSEAAKVTVEPALSVSISPLSASILLSQSVTFTSTTNGGIAPYSYQWYLDGTSVSGATSNDWIFIPSAGGVHYVYLKVADASNNTAQSETARIAVTSAPVGGYSVSFDKPTIQKLLSPSFALIIGLALLLVVFRRKTRRRD